MSFKLVNMFLWGGESETIVEGQGVSTAQPQVFSVVGADGKIQVTFDQVMNTQPGSPLYSRDSYYLTDLEFGWRIPIFQVDLISGTEVELTPVEWFPHNPRLYTLRVVNATNQYGQVVDPANNTVQFAAQNTQLVDVDDTLGFYTSNQGFDSDIASALSPDIDKPLIQNQDPSPGALNVNPTYPITLELIDQEQLIDTTSVKLTVNGDVVYENETDAPGEGS
jgi:hypothetical protein